MSVNVYITTIDLYKPLHDQRRVIQDMCIDGLKTPDVAQYFELKGIITPEWCNPDRIDNYKDTPVQSVETRDLKNYDSHDPWRSRDNCPVINVSRKRGTLLADNEHLSLFENMTIETPCLLLDGDILLYCNSNLRALYDLLTQDVKPEGHSICASHAVYFSCDDDRDKDLISMQSHINPCSKVQLIRDTFFRCSTHMSRAMHSSMTTYRFVNTANA